MNSTTGAGNATSILSKINPFSTQEEGQKTDAMTPISFFGKKVADVSNDTPGGNTATWAIRKTYNSLAGAASKVWRNLPSENNPSLKDGETVTHSESSKEDQAIERFVEPIETVIINSEDETSHAIQEALNNDSEAVTNSGSSTVDQAIERFVERMETVGMNSEDGASHAIRETLNAAKDRVMTAHTALKSRTAGQATKSSDGSLKDKEMTEFSQALVWQNRIFFLIG